MQLKPKRPSIYEQFRKVCEKKHTNISSVLSALGKSTGSTGTWKSGGYPKLDVAMDIAEYLNVSLDELCYGDKSKCVILNDNEREWLSIIRRIPEDRQGMCKDFIRTHIVVPEKYEDAEKRIS